MPLYTLLSTCININVAIVVPFRNDCYSSNVSRPQCDVFRVLVYRSGYHSRYLLVSKHPGLDVFRNQLNGPEHKASPPNTARWRSTLLKTSEQLSDIGPLGSIKMGRKPVVAVLLCRRAAGTRYLRCLTWLMYNNLYNGGKCVVGIKTFFFEKRISIITTALLCSHIRLKEDMEKSCHPSKLFNIV